MPKIDFDKITAEHSISSVVGRLVKLASAGKGEFTGLCPFHAEKTPSFTVSENKGFYHCYGCGAHGDVLDFVAQSQGVSISEAVKILTGGEEFKPSKRKGPIKTFDPYEGIKAAEIPDSHEMFQPGEEIEVWNPRRERVWKIRPSMVFPYTAHNGELLGYVLRVEFDDGKKVTPTIRYVTLPDGSHTWATFPFDAPRNLYGLERIGDAKQVVIVEGEKAADAAQRMLPIPVLTWPGGTQGVKHADWSALEGISVVIWPDADEPGLAAAEEIAGLLTGTVKIARPEADRPKGWDAADAEAEGWTREEAIKWLRDRVAASRQPEEPPVQGNNRPINSPARQKAEEPPPHEEAPEGPDHEEPPPALPAATAHTLDRPEAPFRVLGFDKGVYYYLPSQTRQVVALTASQHTLKHLLQLAPIEWWLDNFPGKGKVDENAATNSLMALAHQRGPFYPERMHGRGAWLEESGPVFHMGREALVGSDIVDLYQVSQENIYEATRPIKIAIVPPASNKEASRLVNICHRLSWENDLSGIALAGWIAIAPICGALPWRPHIWITGGAGTGKTTVMFDIVGRMLKKFSHSFEGNTTEAGIRQTVGDDALPILFDEAEAENERAQGRMTSIMELARFASSGGTVTKGTTNGEPLRYRIRSAIAFSSIETSIKQHADETRITKLVLRRRDGDDADQIYKDLMRDIREWLTPEFVSAMFMRAWHNIETTLANIQTCIDAAAQELRDRRAADQIGTLIGGYISLHTTQRISFDKAVEFVRRYDWTDHTAISAAKDVDRLLERITTARQSITANGKVVQTTIGELIWALEGDYDAIGRAEAKTHLGALGIRRIGNKLAIANNGTRLGREILRGTQWESDWSRPLRDVPGAEKSEKNIHFHAGLKCRAVLLPLEVFAKPKDEPLHRVVDEAQEEFI